MNIVINGCGQVARALLHHWMGLKEAPKILLLRNSTHQLSDDRGLNEKFLTKYLENPQPFTQPLQSMEKILQKPIDMWFELTPTDLKTSKKIHSDISKVLDRGIPVVFANKAPLLYDYISLKELADARNVHLGLSGVLGASLPSYALGHYGTMGAQVLSMEGILNGTSNFILKKMEEGVCLEEALAIAQELGIAENNWAYDVDGFDSAIKMSLLASVILNKNMGFENKNIQGIRDLSLEKIQSLKSQGKKIKLVSSFEKDIVRVAPRIYEMKDLFYHVQGSDKALRINTDKLSDMTLIGGKSGLNEVAASLHRDLLWIKELTGV